MFFINKNSNNFSFLHLNHFFFLYNYKKNPRELHHAPVIKDSLNKKKP